ncbi:hypothetical protein SAMN05421777_105114 [Fluoribacter gormanii]|uniref:Uncharacterized protein n=1 Tax=Fluoribacter gormanii TaxID=464 RepID=A0A377GNL1_9GAMM|nr:hypothetical protein SAMN05421777_105114 [Fluoribacter gormanii]STO26085.1 Uncharacterised protein [Fluoribacter gormanii]
MWPAQRWYIISLTVSLLLFRVISLILFQNFVAFKVSNEIVSKRIMVPRS